MSLWRACRSASDGCYSSRFLGEIGFTTVQVTLSWWFGLAVLELEALVLVEVNGKLLLPSHPCFFCFSVFS